MCRDALSPAIVPTLIFDNLSFMKAWISIVGAHGERTSGQLTDASEPFSGKSEHGSKPHVKCTKHLPNIGCQNSVRNVLFNYYFYSMCAAGQKAIC